MDFSLLQRKQLELRERVAVSPLRRTVRTVGGCDVSYISRNAAIAAACVMSFPSLEVLEWSSWRGSVPLPYVPGYLSFRELPVLERAFSQLTVPVDVLLVDGQGIAHPRRLGLASHLGIALDVPTIGCAKSRLCGEFEPPDHVRGSFSLLRTDGEVAGLVLRTQTGVRPVFVSPGHLVDIYDCLRIVMGTVRRCRIPEPIRMAHALSRRFSQWESSPVGRHS